MRLLEEADAGRARRRGGRRRAPGARRGLEATLRAERERPPAPAGAATAEHPAAYFCAEYGVHASLPIYSGGLGALAGDILKEAADRALPLVAVGLLYRQGYFRQRVDGSGWQHEYWVRPTPSAARSRSSPARTATR